VRILLIGSLSWNPERIRSLHEQGHALFGVWARSMDWDQGPYPVLEGAVQSIPHEDAVRVIRSQRIECVLGLYQAYPKLSWGPPRPGVEHDLGVWDLLRALLVERSRGEIDVPIVFHHGFDVSVLDPGVARALDGHIVCNEHKLRWWTTPLASGGCGLDVFGDPALVAFLDGDRPKAEFMNDRFSERLSDRDGEIHTVCIGRPVHIDVVAAAQRGIHVHVYGNRVDEVHAHIERDLSLRRAWRHRALLRRHLHVHTSLQTIGLSWPEVQRQKSRWVEEFSRYDAGWSYIGAPSRWYPLDDRAAIPNRLGTYLLAGLPVIADPAPGFDRFDSLVRLGVALELGAGGYDGLREQLAAEIASREKSARAREVRRDHSFDAGIPALLAALERARQRYLARPHAERIRFEAGAGAIEFRSRPRDGGRRNRGPGGAKLPYTRPQERPPREARPGHRRRRKEHLRRRRVRRLAAILTGGEPVAARAASGGRRIGCFERFAEPSRRCGAAAEESGAEAIAFELHRVSADWWPHRFGLLAAFAWWLGSPLRVRHPLRLLAACLRARDVRLGALCFVPVAHRRVRAGKLDELACFSAKGFEVVPLLAAELGVPFREVLATGTQYFGEFAFELLAVVPYAYWLHEQGRLERTVSSPDTRCLYYFSKDHREVPGPRRFVPITEYPAGEMGERRFDKLAFPACLDRSRWAPPPYAERFRDQRFAWDRPACIVCNKASSENDLGGARVNSIDTDVLVELIARLRARYQVVYDRPRGSDIVNDAHQRVGELGDFEAIASRFPDVFTIQALHARHPELSFNELQLRLFAGCRRFVSVVGGSAYLASWFGGVNVVYARAGWEVDCGAFASWFDAFSGARVIAVSSPEELLRAVEQEFLSGPPVDRS
jgi:hypothetical protein